MENRRFILIALMGVVLFFMYQAWQTDYGPEAQQHKAISEQVQLPQDDADTPTLTEPAVAGEHAPAAAPAAGVAAAPAKAAGRVHVETDLLIADISLKGGELSRLELVGYPEYKEKPDNLALLDDRNGRRFVLQSGLAGTSADHKAVFSAAQPKYTLADGSDALEVALDYTDASGYSVRKVYTFKRGSYEISLRQELKNSGAATVKARPYARFERTIFKVGTPPKFTPAFLGIGLYEQKEPGSASYRFKKIALDKLAKDPVQLKQDGGWLAMMQHYFIAAIIPPAGEKQIEINAVPTRDGAYKGEYVGETVAIAPQAEHAFDTRLFIGPQLQDTIDNVVPGFGLTLDYGILTPLATPIFWFLKFIHQYVGNWGFSIILLTLAVKLLMFKLSEAQYRSMAKMKKFGPRIQDMKERYGDDRERLQKAMMDLYKKEGFNPLAGCWPLLVQMPVFFALYWVLLQSVELRQVPFVLWINDLSAPDPYFVLPVLYGLSLWVQQKISGQNATMDPMQQKMMNAMPLAFTAFFTFFPSGLVLYWVASTLIGLAQQWYITRKLENETAAKA